MKLSLNWIKQFVELPKDLTPEEIQKLLTLKTAEIEGIENEAEALENMVIGKVVKITKHPDADSLNLCQTDIGSKEVQIVCGGSNVEEGMLAAIALPGSKVKWHGEGDLIAIEETKIRGEKSFGMIAASSEIGLGPSEGKEIMNLTNLGAKPGTPLAEALGKDDVLLDIDNKSLTNRPDLWSHYGFARELSAITGSPLKKIEYNFDFPKSGETPTIKIETPEVLKESAFVIIKNIEIKESPTWLKQRLQSIGINPVNNIVDITNFVPWEMGQPLHAYDLELSTDKITLRHAKDGEILETIDHKKRKLAPHNYVIANESEPLLLNGLMGGAKSEIRSNTTEILLESAVWDATIVRKASQEFGLRTDASTRYEKDIDPNLTLPGLIRAIELILELCPEAVVAGPPTHDKVRELKSPVIELDKDRVNRYLGTQIDHSEMQKILESLEFKVEDKKDKFIVTVPTFRATKDVTEEVDLIEEIGRIYGYEEIEAKLPILPVQMPIANLSRRREHQARSILTKYGASEVSNYSFYSKKDLKNCLLDETKHLKLKNFLSEDQTHMRISMLPHILKNIETNVNNFDQLQIFELGRTYTEIGEYFPAEETKIAIAVTDPENPFRKLKGLTMQFFEDFSHQEFNFKKDDNAPESAHPNKAAIITDSDGNTLANLYIIHPLIKENTGLKVDVAYAEINFGRLLHEKSHSVKMTPIPKFPDLEFDISILLDKKTEAEKVEEAILTSSELIFKISLFDIYEGKNIPEDKKSLSYRITLRSEDKTLTDQEMANIQQQCFSNLEKIGGQIRGR